MYKKDIPPRLTYMIAETLIPAGELDITKFREFGLGERNPATLPGVRSDSESDWQNDHACRRWRAARRWVQTANSSGFKYAR